LSSEETADQNPEALQSAKESDKPDVPQALPQLQPRSGEIH
jgi:hypothetical protein